MGIENTILMEPVKNRLRNLREYLPEESELVYGFGAYLAEELRKELDPIEFYIVAEFSIMYLRKGTDSPTGQRRTDLVGYSADVYTNLRMRIPLIAEAVCPEDFAEQVCKAKEEISRSCSF